MYKSNEIVLEIVFNGKRKTQELDVISFVKKPLENFVYKKSLRSNRVALTYFESEKLFSEDNIFLNNKHQQIKENINVEIEKEEKVSFVKGKSLTVPFKEIYATNVFTKNVENEEVPLFYIDNPNADNIELFIETNLDYTEPKSYLIQNGAIYHNFENHFNEKTGEYCLYYILYNKEGSSVRRLLKSNPVVKELSWEDVDLETGMLKENTSGYQIEKNVSEYTYNFDKSDKYYWFPKETNFIKLNKPKGRESEEPWYLQVSNGEFSTIKNNTLYKYKVEEYQRQLFAPTYPYMYSNFFNLDWVSEKVLKTDTNSIEKDKEKDLHIDIFVYDEDENLVRVLSTDETKKDERFKDTDIFWEGDIINSVDEERGFIELNEKFSEKYRYRGNFFFKQEYLEFKDINLNPLSNPSVLDYYFVIYIIPNLYYYEKSIHFLKIDHNGKIIECSQGQGLKSERANYPVLSLKDEVLKINNNTIVGKTYEEFKKLYSSEGDNIYQYLILGEVGFKESSSFDDSLSFSVSEKGNCFKKSKRKEVFRKNNKLLQSKYGYGANGYMYQLDNSSYIEVPLELSEEYGGEFTEKEIIEIIDNRMPGYCKNIIKWIYPKSKIKIDNSIQGEIKIDILENINLKEKYLIYRKEHANDKYEVIAELDADQKEFLDKSLVSDKIYYYKIKVKKGLYIYPECEEVEVYVR